MEPNFEKNHLDDLFARRLGKLERSPSSDSFARLQQRMQGGQSQPQMVFWRNPTVQMSAAACVALFLLFGWLYTNDQSLITPSQSQAIAVTGKKQPTSEPATGNTSRRHWSENGKTTQQLADNKPVSKQPALDRKSSSYSTVERSHIPFGQKPQLARLATTKATEQVRKAVEMTTDKQVPPQMIAAVPAASTTAKPTAERVLIVTIDEPEALVAARQTATSVVNNMPVLAASPTKEGKASFWSQVKRLKQDDDVAHQEGSTDESGLLSRAYKGIRQKLEKDKTVKQ
jgi:hypothetical protein